MAKVIFQPHSAQQKVLDSQKDCVLAVAGVRGGKSWVGAVWLIQGILEDIKAGIHSDYLIASPSYKILNQATMIAFKRFFPTRLGEWKQYEIDLPTGNKIYLRSVDNPSSVVGMSVRRVWLDEGGLCKKAVFDNLQQRITQPEGVEPGRLLITTTPYGTPKHWINTELITKQKEHQEWLDVINWSTKDNIYISKRIYDRAKGTMSASLFQRDFEGIYTVIEGLIYPDFSIERHILDKLDYSNMKLYAGLDYGFSPDPTAIVVVAEDKDLQRYIIIDTFYHTKKTAKEIAEWLKRYKLAAVYHDPSAVGMVNEIKQWYKGNFVSAKNDIDAGINRVTSFLRTDKLLCLSECMSDFISEIQSYIYDERTGKPKAKQADHLMDATKYVLLTLNPASNRPPKKTAEQVIKEMTQPDGRVVIPQAGWLNDMLRRADQSGKKTDTDYPWTKL